MTPREVDALSKVYDSVLVRWAIERAMFANAYFVGENDTPWLAADFLSESNREERQRLHGREQLLIAQANMNLMGMRKGDPAPEGLPDWAKG